jgi:4a-hydroxytetrahydrobiopterin dehydratase
MDRFIFFKEDNNSLSATFKHKSFMEAITFVTDVAEISEILKHHPEIHINYQKVTLKVTTHDAGDIITEKDIELATLIERLYTSNHN